LRLHCSKTIPTGATSVGLSDIAPAVLTAIRFDPPLPAGVSARVRLEGDDGAGGVSVVSVGVADMLAVPDWTEARSPCGRALQEFMEASGGGVQPFIDQSRYRDVRLLFEGTVPATTRVHVEGLDLTGRY
jgi:hypothetical protein